MKKLLTAKKKRSSRLTGTRGVPLQPLTNNLMNMNTLHTHYASYPEKVLRKSEGTVQLSHLSVRPLADADLTRLRAAGEEPRLTGRMKWLKAATPDIDRTGDVLVMKGAELANFQRNPQFLWQHALTPEAVHTLGRITRLVVTDDALYALAEYADEGTSGLVDKVFKLDKQGLLPANSIGFRPIEWEPNDQGGFTFTKWELIEVSKVELPANPQAVGLSG